MLAKKEQEDAKRKSPTFQQMRAQHDSNKGRQLTSRVSTTNTPPDRNEKIKSVASHRVVQREQDDAPGSNKVSVKSTPPSQITPEVIKFLSSRGISLEDYLTNPGKYPIVQSSPVATIDTYDHNFNCYAFVYLEPSFSEIIIKTGNTLQGGITGELKQSLVVRPLEILNKSSQSDIIKERRIACMFYKNGIAESIYIHSEWLDKINQNSIDQLVVRKENNDLQYPKSKPSFIELNDMSYSNMIVRLNSDN